MLGNLKSRSRIAQGLNLLQFYEHVEPNLRTHAVRTLHLDNRSENKMNRRDIYRLNSYPVDRFKRVYDELQRGLFSDVEPDSRPALDHSRPPYFSR